MFDALRHRIRLYRARRHPAESPPVEPPPTPDGWRVVPGPAGATSYELAGPLDPATQQRVSAVHIGSVEFVGTNSTAFHGFPAHTLMIGFVSVMIDTATREPRLTLRLDYRPEGWQKPGIYLPTCDYHRLPFAQAEHV